MKYNSVGTELCCHTLVSLLVMVASLCLEEPHESLVNRKLDNQYNTRHLQWRWYHFHEFLRPRLQQQQQHSLFSQASWGRLEMKPERKKFKVQAH